MSQLQKIAGTIAALDWTIVSIMETIVQPKAALGWIIVSIMETIVQPKAATLANCIC